MSVKFSIERACDEALNRIAEGDHEALTVIYDKLGRKIFMLAYSILGERTLAEDVMQQTFVKLITSSSGYKKGTNAVSYILKTTQNLSFNALKKKNRQNECLCPVDETIPFKEEKELSALESLQILSEEDRMIVVLKLDTKSTHKEISALLGISVASCEKRYRRALQKLKEYYRS